MRKNKKQGFIDGILTIFLAQVVIKFFGLFYRLLITNIPYFGDEGNGIYGAGFQVYTLLLSFLTAGVPSAISKLVSEKKALNQEREAHRIFKLALVLFSIIGIIGTSILFFAARYISNQMIGNTEIEGVLIALSPSIFFVAISSVIRGYFNGMHNMKATSYSQMIEQFFKSVLTVMIVVGLYLMAPAIGKLPNIFNLNENNITKVMAAGANLASTVATAIGFIYLYLYYTNCKKEIWYDIKKERKEYKNQSKLKIVKSILYLSISMSLASVVTALSKNIDTFTVIKGLQVSLSKTVSPSMIISEATRLYGILSGKVDMLINLPLSLTIALATTLVPTVSELIAMNNFDEASKKIILAVKISILIALPSAIGIFVLSEPILNLLFPNNYAIEAISLLQISSFTIIFSILTQTINGALQGIGKIFAPAFTLMIGVIIKLILNLFLISRIGINGAAIGTVACYMISSVLGIMILEKNIKINLLKQNFILKIVIATIFMMLAVIVVQNYLSVLAINSKFLVIILITVGCIIYGVSILLLNVFTKEEYKYLPILKNVLK